MDFLFIEQATESRHWGGAFTTRADYSSYSIPLIFGHLREEKPREYRIFDIPLVPNLVLLAPVAPCTPLLSLGLLIPAAARATEARAFQFHRPLVIGVGGYSMGHLRIEQATGAPPPW